MPPKKAAQAPSKKTEMKKKEKVIEDKTFGLKNKKGAKTQKFIQTVSSQVKGGDRQSKKEEEKKKLEKEKKEAELKAKKEMGELFKPVVQQAKIEKGTDPKSILCAFFKQGSCGKGGKCKFSHDLAVERKAEKRSIYCDVRDDEDNMADWDEEKLREVVDQKHSAEAETNKNKSTDIICKYFLDAVENSKYGWFWQCPNGDGCKYRHALPPGFVLNKDKKKAEKGDEISIEELVEKERAALSGTGIRVTLQSFISWKKRKIEEKKQQLKSRQDKKRAEYSAGRSVGISGRDMFTFNPEMAAQGDEEEGGETIDTATLGRDLDDEEEQDDQPVHEVDFDNMTLEDAEEAEAINTEPSGPIDESLFDDDLDDLDEELTES